MLVGPRSDWRQMARSRTGTGSLGLYSACAVLLAATLGHQKLEQQELGQRRLEQQDFNKARVAQTSMEAWTLFMQDSSVLNENPSTLGLGERDSCVD